MADWSQFREYPLPCVGLTEAVEGFTLRKHNYLENSTSSNLRKTVVCSNLKRTSSVRNQDLKQSIVAPYLDHGFHRDKRSSECSDGLALSEFVPPKACAFLVSKVALPEPKPYQTSERVCSELDQDYLDISKNLLSNMSGPITYTPPMSPMCGRVLSAPLSPSHLPGHLGSSASLFTISPHDAAQLVRMVKTHDSPEPKNCYFIHLKLRTMFSEDSIPGTCIRKLPRLLNGIPLGAGFLSRDQISEIRWRLVEGEHSTLTFLSYPLLQDEAEESRTSFRDRLITQAQAVFGDITVRASLSLSKCLDYHDNLVLNDIATNVGDGLQFKD